MIVEGDEILFAVDATAVDMPGKVVQLFRNERRAFFDVEQAGILFGRSSSPCLKALIRRRILICSSWLYQPFSSLHILILSQQRIEIKPADRWKACRYWGKHTRRNAAQIHRGEILTVEAQISRKLEITSLPAPVWGIPLKARNRTALPDPIRKFSDNQVHAPGPAEGYDLSRMHGEFHLLSSCILWHKNQTQKLIRAIRTQPRQKEHDYDNRSKRA